MIRQLAHLIKEKKKNYQKSRQIKTKLYDFSNLVDVQFLQSYQILGFSIWLNKLKDRLPINRLQKSLFSKSQLQYPFSIHPQDESFVMLKPLWASLSSKAQFLGCVFDTPDRDAIPITYGGAL